MNHLCLVWPSRVESGNFTPLPSTGRHLMTQSSTTSTLSTPKNPTNLISHPFVHLPFGGQHVDPLRLDPTSGRPKRPMRTRWRTCRPAAPDLAAQPVPAPAGADPARSACGDHVSGYGAPIAEHPDRYASDLTDARSRAARSGTCTPASSRRSASRTAAWAPPQPGACITKRWSKKPPRCKSSATRTSPRSRPHTATRSPARADRARHADRARPRETDEPEPAGETLGRIRVLLESSGSKPGGDPLQAAKQFLDVVEAPGTEDAEEHGVEASEAETPEASKTLPDVTPPAPAATTADVPAPSDTIIPGRRAAPQRPTSRRSQPAPAPLAPETAGVPSVEAAEAVDAADAVAEAPSAPAEPTTVIPPGAQTTEADDDDRAIELAHATRGALARRARARTRRAGRGHRGARSRRADHRRGPRGAVGSAQRPRAHARSRAHRGGRDHAAFVRARRCRGSLPDTRPRSSRACAPSRMRHRSRPKAREHELTDLGARLDAAQARISEVEQGLAAAEELRARVESELTDARARAADLENARDALSAQVAELEGVVEQRTAGETERARSGRRARRPCRRAGVDRRRTRQQSAGPGARALGHQRPGQRARVDVDRPRGSPAYAGSRPRGDFEPGCRARVGSRQQRGRAARTRATRSSPPSATTRPRCANARTSSQPPRAAPPSWSAPSPSTHDSTKRQPRSTRPRPRSSMRPGVESRSSRRPSHTANRNGRGSAAIAKASCASSRRPTPGAQSSSGHSRTRTGSVTTSAVHSSRSRLVPVSSKQMPQPETNSSSRSSRHSKRVVPRSSRRESTRARSKPSSRRRRAGGRAPRPPATSSSASATRQSTNATGPDANEMRSFVERERGLRGTRRRSRRSRHCDARGCRGRGRTRRGNRRARCHPSSARRPDGRA